MFNDNPLYRRSNLMASAESDSYYKVYEEYAKSVRTWFIAYGIGAPVLVLGNDKLWKQLVSDNLLLPIALLFIGGGVAQILIAMINKWMNWQNFHIEFQSKTAANYEWYDRFTKWLTRQFWIDIVFDIGSTVAFAMGTVILFYSASRITLP